MALFLPPPALRALLLLPTPPQVCVRMLTYADECATAADTAASGGVR